jgi:hypothetical protein
MAQNSIYDNFISLLTREASEKKCGGFGKQVGSKWEVIAQFPSGSAQAILH